MRLTVVNARKSERNWEPQLLAVSYLKQLDELWYDSTSFEVIQHLLARLEIALRTAIEGKNDPDKKILENTKVINIRAIRIVIKCHYQQYNQHHISHHFRRMPANSSERVAQLERCNVVQTYGVHHL